MDDSSLNHETYPGQEAGIPSAAGGLILYRATAQPTQCIARNRPLMKAVNRDLGQVVYFRPACKSWNCPGCALNRKNYWVLAAKNGVEVFQQRDINVDFLTLTSHEKLSAAGTWAILPAAWKKLSQRIRRASETHEYFLIPEPHQDERWHIHALITARLPLRWWKDNARECGFGYQSDVQEVNSLGGVHVYASKYLGKTLQNSNLPKGTKRVRLSQGWPDLPPMPPYPGWIYLVLERDRPLAWDAERYQSEGFQVIVADADSAWDWIKTFGVISGGK